MSYRIYDPGYTAGRLRVVRRVRRGKLEAECLDCGGRREVSTSILAPSSQARRLRCAQCAGRQRRVYEHGVCRWCRVKLSRKRMRKRCGGGAHKTRCSACDRRLARNGACGCGHPRYASRACPGCGDRPAQGEDGGVSETTSPRSKLGRQLAAAVSAMRSLTAAMREREGGS